MRLFVGIDPGQLGGIGVIDERGQFMTANRWDQKNPINIFNKLELIKSQVVMAYLEDVNLPQTGDGLQFQHTPQALLVNQGIWLGWLIGLQIPFATIPPATWQAATGLWRWKKRLAEVTFDSPVVDSPLTLARKTWPAAPLEFKADDGKAVGLLLAWCAYQDHRKGIDRNVIQARAHEKKIIKRKQKKWVSQQTALGYTGDFPPQAPSPAKAKRSGKRQGKRSGQPGIVQPEPSQGLVFPPNFPKIP